MAQHSKTSGGRTNRLRLAALMLVMLCIGVGYGYVSYRKQLFPYGPVSALFKKYFSESTKGHWGTPIRRNDDSLTDADRARISNLATLGYLAGYEAPQGDSGVILHVHERAQPGYNLYTSGHAPEATLMDMDGNVLHTWNLSFDAVWPDRNSSGGKPDRWRRAYLVDNGDLIAIFDHLGVIKVDKDSNLIWKANVRAHHDLEVLPDGRIFVISNEISSHPNIHAGEPFLDDFVTILDGDGKEIDRISVLESLIGTPYEVILNNIEGGPDIFHTNTIEVLDGTHAARSPLFNKGNLLISMRNVSVIAIIDMQTRKVVWAMSGMWKMQHQPTMLPNGHMLLFDNQGHYGFSKVIEFDPLAQTVRKNMLAEFDPLQQKVFWSFEGNVDNAFYSRWSGSNVRLANGNTLITQSESGRVIEVTPEKEIVWEFRNPKRAGENDELIAVIFELLRLDADEHFDWLNG